MSPVTPRVLLRHVEALVKNYPEYLDNPIVVEDQEGILDLMHVTEVTSLNGQLELIVDKAEPVPPGKPNPKRSARRAGPWV